MEEASLPIVTTEMYGRELNRMPGYLQDMGNTAADSLTILPEDRELPIHIIGDPAGVLGISYEIRSMDRKRLVENTALEEWDAQEGSIRVKLPIQNLLTKEQAYLLRLQIDTAQKGPVYYYTRTSLSSAQSSPRWRTASSTAFRL